MKAKFQGRCGNCRQIVLKGEEMNWIDGTVYCLSCSSSDLVLSGMSDLKEIGRGAPKDRCKECYLVHAGECY